MTMPINDQLTGIPQGFFNDGLIIANDAFLKKNGLENPYDSTVESKFNGLKDGSSEIRITLDIIDALGDLLFIYDPDTGTHGSLGNKTISNIGFLIQGLCDFMTARMEVEDNAKKVLEHLEEGRR